jgi:hypothetical protein
MLKTFAIPAKDSNPTHAEMQSAVKIVAGREVKFMAKQGKNIYLRKDGRWEGRYLKGKVDGKRQYGYVFGKTYEDAAQKLDAALMVLAGEDSCSETFETLCTEWLSVQSPELKASSIAKYSNVLKSYLLPKFGKEDVCSISRNDVMLFSRELLGFRRCSGKWTGT